MLLSHSRHRLLLEKVFMTLCETILHVSLDKTRVFVFEYVHDYSPLSFSA